MVPLGEPPNNSFERGLDCISFMLFCPFKVGGVRAARLIPALGVSNLERNMRTGKENLYEKVFVYRPERASIARL